MVTLTELVETLREIFANSEVNVAEVMHLMESYKSNPAKMETICQFDEHKYTRNLVDIGNGKYNLIILCWGPGMGILHDHHGTCHNCFAEFLMDHCLRRKAPLKKIEETRFDENGIKLGLHRLENPKSSPDTSRHFSLHLLYPLMKPDNAFD
ncbi:cysteine dioxygenase type I [Cooperia oncophora]